MLAHREIVKLLADQSHQATALTELRQSTVALQVPLSADMASSLGTSLRRLTPFLATVVDVIGSKLEVDDDELKLSRVAETKQARKWLGDDWSIMERELWQCVVRDGSAYVLTAWTDKGPKFCVREAYNGVCGAGVAEQDGEPLYGFNTWQHDKTSYCDLYYPERIEKYIKGSSERDEWTPRQDTPDEVWPIDWTDNDGQPLGIALVGFCIDNSDIADALQIGRDLNETMLDMLAASRTQGWPQRYLKGQRNADVLTNELGQPVISSATGRPIRRAVHAAPGSIMLLSDGSEMGQLTSSKADPTVLDKLLELLSFVTSVPSHYFSGQWPSGIALIQGESRLNHKIEEHQARLSSGLVGVIRLAMRLSNFFAGTGLDAEQQITVPWCSPEVETEDLKRERAAFQMDSLSKLVEAGLMSKEVAVRELHPEWDDEQIQAELVRLGAVQPDVLNTALQSQE